MANSIKPKKKEAEVTVDPIKGTIVDCDKVRIRSSAKETNSNVIDYAPCGTEVLIFPDESTKDFYKVITAFGVEGFIMRQFVDTF